jgi:hypothetical protein
MHHHIVKGFFFFAKFKIMELGLCFCAKAAVSYAMLRCLSPRRAKAELQRRLMEAKEKSQRHPTFLDQ